MKVAAKVFYYYMLGLLGIVLVSAAPTFFMSNGLLGVFTFAKEVVELIVKIVQPSEWVYQVKMLEKPILPYLWDPYRYSITVLIGALGLGFFSAIVLGGLTIFLPSLLRGFVKRVLNLLETIPDLLIAFILQITVVAVYKKYDLLLFKFATLGDDRIYMAPIVTLAILPTISLYKLALLLMEEEMTKHYVEFAQSKGVKHKSIIVFHIFRNIVQSLFYHSKIMVWSTLSSLLVIEYIFNMNGITTYILKDFRPVVTAIILWMLFTPFFLFYQSVELYLNRNELKTVTVKFKGAKFLSNWHKWPIWNLMWRGFIETLRHFKNVKFLIGATVIFGMLGYSVYHSVTADVLVEKYTQIYEDDKLVSVPPHSPEVVFMGTDRLGFSIWDQILAGAKYTILFATIVAFLRTAGGLALAVPYAFWMKDRWRNAVDKLIDSIHYLPLSVMALIILQPVLLQGMSGDFQNTMVERIILEILVLTILALPLITTLLGNEIRLLLQKEFILGARVLGGNKRHMLWRHLLPHLGSRLGIIFGQQFIYTLIVFIHLAVFGLFVGGTLQSNDPLFPAPPRSASYEWSGLIISSRTALMSGQYWRILPVLVAFMLLIFAMQLVVEGIKDVQQARVGAVPGNRRSWIRRLKRMRKDKQQKREVSVDETSFGFVKRQSK